MHSFSHVRRYTTLRASMVSEPHLHHVFIPIVVRLHICLLFPGDNSLILHSIIAGSAAHVHISVHPLNDNKSGDRSDQLAPTLSPHSRSFLQSLLTYLPSICAFTLPTQFSYGRMLDGIWSGGTWVGWGIESRESPIRVTGPNAPATRSSGNGGGQHFEVRCIDGTSSPYLALAAILGAGAKGVAENATLSVRGVEEGEGAKTIAEMSDKERFEAGVGSSRLPLTLAEARTRLSGDQGIRDLLSHDFVDKYLSVNEVRYLFLHHHQFVAGGANFDIRQWRICSLQKRRKLRSRN